MCIYSHMFKLQSLSKYSPFDAIHLLRFFFHCSKQVLNSLIWCLLVFLPFLALHLPHQQNVSLWGLILSRETKKCCLGQDQVNGELGTWGLGRFCQKLRNTQPSVGRSGALAWNGQTPRKSLWKKFTEAECSLSQQHQLVLIQMGSLNTHLAEEACTTRSPPSWR